MPANIVDVDAFTTPVVVPVDGDDYDASSVEVGFQALANRTLNLQNQVTDLFDTVKSYPHTVTRQWMMPLSGFVKEASSPWTYSNATVSWGTVGMVSVPGDQLDGHFKLPNGAIVTNVEIYGAAVGPAFVEAYRLDGAGTLTAIGGGATFAGTGLELVTVTAGGAIVPANATMAETSLLLVRFESDPIGTGASMFFCRVTFTGGEV